MPTYDYEPNGGLLGLAWRVHPTQPMEMWDGIASVEYWVDGVLAHAEEYPHPPDPNAKGPLSILSWTYDGRQAGEMSQHSLSIHAKVWKQTWVYFPFPPTITWSKLDVTPETTPQFILNQPPQLNASMAIASDRTTATLTGSVVPDELHTCTQRCSDHGRWNRSLQPRGQYAGGH